MFFSQYSKIKNSSVFSRTTSFSLIRLGCCTLRSDWTSRSCRHSSQLWKRCFIFFTATISPVTVFCALLTVPKEPSPTCPITV